MRFSLKTGAVVVSAALVAVAAGLSTAAERKTAVAPAFNAKQLAASPQQNWITNGGNVFNQRYSPLTLLNRDNVKDLKALWRTSMGSVRRRAIPAKRRSCTTTARCT